MVHHTKTKYYYKYLANLTILNDYSFMRYPHDIRMKYCGFGCGYGCQNSCGYLRMRIRMRSSDTPLVVSHGLMFLCHKGVNQNCIQSLGNSYLFIILKYLPR